MGEHRFEDREVLAETLARSVAVSLEQAVSERGRASLVVSGGSTPRPFFAALRRCSLPWDKVWITLADDRWVPTDHPRSNEALVRRELLGDPPLPARFVGLVSDAPTPEAGVEECRRRMEKFPRPFDVVVLGMGDDGHTASLFPGVVDAAALDQDSAMPCVAVRPEGDLEPRMSLTLSALVDARRLLLHITGEEKWQVYRRARSEAGAELPIARVLASASPDAEVYWSP